MTHDIILTDKAKEHLLHLRKEYSDEHALRISVQGGGCSGLSYKLEFTTETKSSDIVISDDIIMYIEPKSYIYIVGMTLDYSDGLNGKGFEFKNPNATRTCACGESFSV